LAIIAALSAQLANIMTGNGYLTDAVAALSSIPYASPRQSTTVRHGAIIHDDPARESGNPPMRVRLCRQRKSGAIRRPGAFTSFATQARHVVAAAGGGRHPAGLIIATTP